MNLTLLACVLAAALVIVALAALRPRRDDLSASWFALASSRGLHYRSTHHEAGGSHLEIEGVLGDGVSVLVQTEPREGEPRHTSMELTLSTPLPQGLIVAGEGLRQKLDKLRGGQDIVLGVRGLDDKIIVRGEDEAAIRELLRDERVAAALSEVFVRRAQAQLERGGLRLTWPRLLDGDELGPELELGLRLARALGAASRGD